MSSTELLFQVGLDHGGIIAHRVRCTVCDAPAGAEYGHRTGTVPLDERGLTILRANAGDRVEVVRVAPAVQLRTDLADAVE